jgi:uncharacterized protein (DUF4415 family)
MKIEFDPDKNARNVNLRGISFEDTARFEWDTALVIQDARRDYGVPRYRAFGTIDDAFTPWFSPPGRAHSGLSFFAKPTIERCVGMKGKPNPEIIDKENPEWTDEDFQNSRPASEILPEVMGKELAAHMLKPRGRPKVAETKTHVNLRLDADILEAFKATGPGWQTRINKALREWLIQRQSSPSMHS